LAAQAKMTKDIRRQMAKWMHADLVLLIGQFIGHERHRKNLALFVPDGIKFDGNIAKVLSFAVRKPWLKDEHFKFRVLLGATWFAICTGIYHYDAGNKFFPLFSWDLYTSAEAPNYFYDVLFTVKSGEKVRLSRMNSTPFNRNKVWDLRNKFRLAKGECPNANNFKNIISAIQQEVTHSSEFEVQGASLLLVKSTLSDYLFKKDFSPTEIECLKLF
jgi:hypothetical protein